MNICDYVPPLSILIFHSLYPSLFYPFCFCLSICLFLFISLSPPLSLCKQNNFSIGQFENGTEKYSIGSVPSHCKLFSLIGYTVMLNISITKTLLAYWFVKRLHWNLSEQPIIWNSTFFTWSRVLVDRHRFSTPQLRSRDI